MFKNIDFHVEFQPIIFSNTKKLGAVEALIRATDRERNKNITPNVLFPAVERKGLVLDLDKLSIELALEKFSKLQNDIPLLFLNIENATILNEYQKTDSFILDLCKKFKIKPSSVVLEIKEQKNPDDDVLFFFSNKYKRLGFSIALDDFGTGSSTFDRISIVLPDIIKIDRSLITDCHSNYINQEIIKSIVNVSSNIGTNILCEGAEKTEEVAFCLSAGIQIFQGWYFDKSLKEINNFSYSKHFNAPFAILRKEHQKKFFKRSSILRNTESLCNNIDSIGLKNITKDSLKSLNNTSLEIISFYAIDNQKHIQTTDHFNLIKKKTITTCVAELGFDHSFHPFLVSENYENRIPFLSDEKNDKDGNKIYQFSKIVRDDIYCLELMEV